MCPETQHLVSRPLAVKLIVPIVVHLYFLKIFVMSSFLSIAAFPNYSSIPFGFVCHSVVMRRVGSHENVMRMHVLSLSHLRVTDLVEESRV